VKTTTRIETLQDLKDACDWVAEQLREIAERYGLAEAKDSERLAQAQVPEQVPDFP
jgi:hypothetical protein